MRDKQKRKLDKKVRGVLPIGAKLIEYKKTEQQRDNHAWLNQYGNIEVIFEYKGEKCRTIVSGHLGRD